jgi:hypothetical protein
MSITVQVSAQYYWGFRSSINIDEIIKMSNDDIINYVKNEMEIFFRSNNLLILSEGVKDLKLHIHNKIDYNTDTILYVCSC